MFLRIRRVFDICMYVIAESCCDVLQGFVVSSKQEMSQLAAELFAVVCVECHNESVDVVSVINDLITDTHSKVCTASVIFHIHSNVSEVV